MTEKLDDALNSYQSLANSIALMDKEHRQSSSLMIDRFDKLSNFLRDRMPAKEDSAKDSGRDT